MASEIKPQDSSRKRSLSYVFVPIASIVFFSLGFIPLILYVLLIKLYLPFDQYWPLLSLPLLIYFGISITFLSQMFISGAMIRFFHLLYEPGLYPYTTKEKNALKWMIVVSIYTPIRKILEIIPMGRMKNTYLRLIGMKIGENSLVGGVIKDPCITSVGDNTTMGEYAIVYGHIHNFERGTILIDAVHIGSNCVIGAGAIIMPGVVVEDNVTIAAGALVTKGKKLTSGNIYAGIPAKKIS